MKEKLNEKIESFTGARRILALLLVVVMIFGLFGPQRALEKTYAVTKTVIDNLQNYFDGYYSEQPGGWYRPTANGNTLGTTAFHTKREGYQVSKFTLDFTRNFEIETVITGKGSWYKGFHMGFIADGNFTPGNYNGPNTTADTPIWGYGVLQNNCVVNSFSLHQNTGNTEAANNTSYNTNNQDGYYIAKTVKGEKIESLQSDEGNKYVPFAADEEVPVTFKYAPNADTTTGTMTITMKGTTFTYKDFNPMDMIGSMSPRFYMSIHDNSTTDYTSVKFISFGYTDFDMMNYTIDAFTADGPGASVASTIGKNDKVATTGGTDPAQDMPNYAKPGKTILVRQTANNNPDVVYPLDESRGGVQMNIPMINLAGTNVKPNKVYWGTDPSGADAKEITEECYNGNGGADTPTTATITVPGKGAPVYVYYELTIPEDYQETTNLDTNIEMSVTDVMGVQKSNSNEVNGDKPWTVFIAGVPTLTLADANKTKTVTVGTTLTEADYREGLSGYLYDSKSDVKDLSGADPTNMKLTIDSTAVDTSKPGTYPVKYTLTDTRSGVVSKEVIKNIVVKGTLPKDNDKDGKPDEQVPVDGPDDKGEYTNPDGEKVIPVNRDGGDLPTDSVPAVPYDGDGADGVYTDDDGKTPLVPKDTDGDGTPDVFVPGVPVDDDGDGVADRYVPKDGPDENGVVKDPDGKPLVPETDEKGDPVKDKNGNPVYTPAVPVDDDGDGVPDRYVPKDGPDENGVVKDPDGKPLVPEKDKNGKPVVDKDGNPVYTPAVPVDDDGDGEPDRYVPKDDPDGDGILRDPDNGQPLVPEKDEYGKPVVDDDGNPVYEPGVPVDDDGDGKADRYIPQNDPDGDGMHEDEEGNKYFDPDGDGVFVKWLVPVTVDPPVKKVVTGKSADTSKGNFSFSMEGKNGAPMPKAIAGKTKFDQAKNILTADRIGAGGIEFGDIEYTVDLVPNKGDSKTFTYVLGEVNTGNESYTYDKTLYTMTVTITNNGDALVKEVSYKTADGKVVDENNVTFTNVYKVQTLLPDTGDKTDILPWMYVMLISAVGTIVAANLQRKKEEN